MIAHMRPIGWPEVRLVALPFVNKRIQGAVVSQKGLTGPPPVEKFFLERPLAGVRMNIQLKQRDWEEIDAEVQ
ncbi:hypothetical protein CDL15_Pgr020769 [Punica granatum]|uniref:Uncharacterized protein n=1 Tax=Punica granatum TaxID=22663 RepID=A0A218XUH7_PUNGR|nr:hypothetical protein CDL15_Pgr020769 [Punica granatum]